MIWLHIGAGSVSDLTEETAEGLRQIEKMVNGVEDIYITHIRGGQHMAGSFHPYGRAWDMRKLKMFNVMDIRKCLGHDFDVVPHSTHTHIEFDPK